jgi:REase_DpnII-MboI
VNFMGAVTFHGIPAIPTAFVWDDSSRSQEHDYLKQDLRKRSGVIDVVVVSRPTDWNRLEIGKP